MAIDMPRPIEALDRALHALEADAQRLALQDAYRHVPEPLEAEFAALAITHPEACSTAADYPGWAEQLAALAETNRRPKEGS
ncbi:hypothetical protein C9F11_37885 [Streptomyces sp. YIM 121038]|uniref:hypothetical protein n=1 Tax=Streptomyces sp. YIM 121038 TaxID=2136401 RepID=UPI0011109C01|nr:hypothetical protein [Streptomyces sp. YIM 121038]QCX81160.1 hypothetical protein C9F11_37885 [Streptomyces sp. YIM 121038]